MNVAVFSTKPYDRESLDAANAAAGHPHVFTYLEAGLDPATAALAKGAQASAACVFVNDRLGAATLEALSGAGVRLVALRCAGFDRADLACAGFHGLTIVRVPAYSPHAVAEHTVAMILALNRRLPRAYQRVREGNLALDGLLGFDLHGKTVGVVGTGRIGALVARALALGFGCRILAHDPFPDVELTRAADVRYVPLDELLAGSHVVTLHCPLTHDNHRMINADTLARMKPRAMLINTGRGALVDTRAVIAALKRGHLGYLGLDVYEEEVDLFFEDHSDGGIADDVFSRLLTFPDVLITGHQAFFTAEALAGIAETTVANLSEFEATGACANAVRTL